MPSYLRLHRPPVAIPMVTVLVVGSMTPALVRAQASTPWARGLLDVALVAAGLILWIPVIGRIPGIPRLKPMVRFGYLVAQAVVPAFLSFIYIFSNHPLYPDFARSHAAVGLRPLNDQQIAGFVSKLSMLLVLLIVGGVVLSRAPARGGVHRRRPPGVGRRGAAVRAGRPAGHPGRRSPPAFGAGVGGRARRGRRPRWRTRSRPHRPAAPRHRPARRGRSGPPIPDGRNPGSAGGVPPTAGRQLRSMAG